jgi:serine/threonine protein phosphatase PrpC
MKIALPPLVLPPHSISDDPPIAPPSSGLILPNQILIKEDERVKGVSKRLQAGYAETTGVRKTMEDRLVICGSLRSRDDEDYFAVFDGHNGVASAKYCAGKMHIKLMELLDSEEDPISLFKATFHLTNTELEKHTTQGGTTAVVAYFKGNDMYIANVGDSRAVLCRNRQAQRITTDHKPDLQLERERIERNGGWVKNGGITGTLTVSRALGDFSYKPFITCEPDVFGPYCFTDDSHQFLILACDGLWDVVSDEEAVEIVLSTKNAEEAAVRLRDHAFNSQSQDNISVLVVFFPNFINYLYFNHNNNITTETESEQLTAESSGSKNNKKARAIKKQPTKIEDRNIPIPLSKTTSKRKKKGVDPKNATIKSKNIPRPRRTDSFGEKVKNKGKTED